MTTPRPRGLKPLWFHDLWAEHRTGPSVVICPECGSHPHSPTAFCTQCGWDLLSGLGTRGPLSVGSWTPDSAQLSDSATEPIPGARRPPPQSASVDRSSQPSAHPVTPVNEMVGSERAEWIDRVWCSAAGVAR